MKNFKKLLLIMATVLCVIIPAMFLTACGGGGGQNGDEIMNIYIKVDDNDYLSQTGFIYDQYGISLSDVDSRVSYVFEFRDGTRKSSEELTEQEIEKITSMGEISEKYYLGTAPENGGQYTWTEISKNDLSYNGQYCSNGYKVNAGRYKIVRVIAGRSLELEIQIEKSEEDATNLRISVLPNNSSSYNSYSSYKYGCPTYKNYQYNPETYKSDYKVQVYDYGTNKIVSGTNVTKVYALPQTAPADRTIQSYWDGVSSVEIHTGDNLITKYNEIDCENVYFKKSMQESFLSSYAQEITISNYNNNEQSTLMYDENTMVVNTECLVPGDFYLIAEYKDENHTGGYTTPKLSNTLKVQKGDFIWKNTINKDGEDYSEEEATNFINSLTFSLDYWFGTYSENPLFTNGNNKALSMDFLKTLTIQIDSNYPDIPDNQGGMNTWQNYMNSSPVCFGGRGAFGWYKLELTGKKLNGQTVTALDCSDMDANGCIQLQAKIKFEDEDLKKYYNEDQTIYPVTVTLHKGMVSNLSYGGNTEIDENGIVNFNFEYDGTTKSPEIYAGSYGYNDYLKYYDILGRQSATEISDYTIIYKLKDNINYYIENCDSDQIKFLWHINKITFDDYELINSSRCMYNGAVVSEDDGNGGVYYPKEITYNPNANNNKTIIVMIDNEKFNFLKTKDENVSINFSIDNNNSSGVIGATISQEQNDQFTLTFSDCSSDTLNYVDIKLSINGTAYSNAYNPGNAIRIYINKLAYTSEELATIYGSGLMFTATEEYGSVNYSLASSIQISQVTRVVPLTAVPSTVDQTITNAMGQWEIYYEYENNETLVVPGSTQLPNNCYRLKYHFVPNDDMYVEIADIYADIDWYKEDIPDAVLTALQTELTTHFNNQTPSITFEIRSDCIAISQDALPTHDLNNTDFQGIDGTWKLVYQYEDNNGVTEEHLAGENNSLIYYDWFENCSWYSSDDYAINANYLISSDRNWQIVFEPENNNAYNRYYISSEIVITHN